MDAIETLMNEHRQIEHVLDAMETFARELGESGGEDREELARFVTFLNELADSIHHGKEEAILFAAMAAHGFPTEAGPIAVMLSEHNRGRGLIRTLDDHSGQPESWTAADRTEVAEASRAYSSLLRAHIQKEDRMLYPMAKAGMPAEAMDEVSRRCDEHDQSRSAEIERLKALSNALVARHPASPREAHERPCSACG
jgi:hemerythrin-like domain-containing protein